MQIIALNRSWTLHAGWLLTVFLVVAALLGLAAWQLERADTKTLLQERLARSEQQGAVPVSEWQVLSPAAVDGTRIINSGRWLAPYVWLLDNQMLNSRIGYDLIIPMQLDGGEKAVLVNLGWIAAPVDRAHLPEVIIPPKIQVQGIIRNHWGGPVFGQNLEDLGRWPMRIQKVDIAKLGAYLPVPLYPALIYQLDDSPFKVHYRTVIMPPERHRAYALQWGLLALAVVVIAVVASAKPVKVEPSAKTGALQ